VSFLKGETKKRKPETLVFALHKWYFTAFQSLLHILYKVDYALTTYCVLAESLSLHHHLVSFSWKPLSIITWHSHISLGLVYGFAGCWMLDHYVDLHVVLWPDHLPSFYQQRFELIYMWFFMAKMPFGQCTRPTLFCIITPLHALDLSQKVQGRGSKYCIVMPERNKYGACVRWSTRRMVQGPSLYAPRKNLGGCRRAYTIIVYLYELN